MMKFASLALAITSASILGVSIIFAPSFAKAEDFQKSGANAVTQEQFLKVMQTSCVRCHAFSNNVNALVERKWIVPGKPENSPLYEALGKGKKKTLENGRYHNVSPDAKAVIRDFIANYK